ncbi:MAG TPA: DUF5329 family protein [Casimicrobium sp.]|nr:DUF5329 family protein [Casimicrobium sp.]
MRLQQIFSRVAIFAVMIASAPIAFGAEISVAGKAEVEQLLSRLAASDCQFNRNGSWYSPAEARDHLNRKFQYAVDKKLLSSADDFISVIGTKSSSSGTAYAVKCGNATAAQPSAEWLSAELRKLRANKIAIAK